MDREPTKWGNAFFDTLYGFEWELSKSPAGAHQWKPKNGAGAGTVPDAHDPAKKHAPTMLTTDLALRIDPAYAQISKRFHEHPQEFADAFAKLGSSSRTAIWDPSCATSVRSSRKNRSFGRIPFPQ